MTPRSRRNPCGGRRPSSAAAIWRLPQPPNRRRRRRDAGSGSATEQRRASARRECLMSSQHSPALATRARSATPAIKRLLFVSDAAVADVDALPPAVRAIIDATAELYVLTPTLPGRLAWLADDVDRFRHYADERLDAVLSHMHAIGANADGE